MVGGLYPRKKKEIPTHKKKVSDRHVHILPSQIEAIQDRFTCFTHIPQRRCLRCELSTDALMHPTCELLPGLVRGR